MTFGKRKDGSMQVTRRGLLQAAAGAGAAAALGQLLPSRAGAAEDDKPGRKPNVLFLFTDDQRPDCIGALGNEHIKTPNMDKLVHRGFTFTHTYCMGSSRPNVCLPSRIQTMTGRHMFSIEGRVRTPSWPEAMSRAGYATIRSGKEGSHYGGREFDENHAIRRSVQTPVTHVDNVLKFIRNRSGKPFFAYVAFGGPHDPQHATDTYYDMYDADKIPLPQRFRPLHPFDNGEMTIRDEKTLPWPRTPETVKGKLARYYASITYIDAQIGRLIGALEEMGELDNTLVIFSSDNGLSMGDHGLLGKQNLYEYGGMHVPLVFAGPGVGQGRTDSMAYLHDIYPTVCDLAGVATPEGLDGASLTPVIRGKSEVAHKEILTAYKDLQRAWRDDRWKIIRYPKIDHTQLFDLKNDPLEQNNLAYDPAQAGKVNDMLRALAAAQARVGDKCPLTVVDPAEKAWSPPA